MTEPVPPAEEPGDDARYMALALAQARAAAQAGEVPVGAVLVQGGRVVAAAHNAPIALCDPTAHAEMRVLREGAQALGNYRLSDCDLYVTAEPCAMCAGAILNARIRRVVYATPEPRTGAAGSQVDLFGHAALNAHTRIEGGVLAPQASALMREFFAAQRARQARERPPRLREDAVRLPPAVLAAARRALGWPEDWRSLWLPVNGGEGDQPPWQIHCMQGGATDPSAPLAVLVHGWADHGWVWRDWAQALADEGWRVLVPDLPGHGLSDKPKHARCLSPAQAGGLLARLVHALGWNAAGARVLALDASAAPGWQAAAGEGRDAVAAPDHLLWVDRPALRQWRAARPGRHGLARPVPPGFPATPKALAALLHDECEGYGATSVFDSTAMAAYPDAGHLTMCRQWAQSLGAPPCTPQEAPSSPAHGARRWVWSELGETAVRPALAGPPIRTPRELLDLPGFGRPIPWSAALRDGWHARLG
jgi:tRNA(adenine34) deaminase